MDGEDRSGMVILGRQPAQDTAALLLEPMSHLRQAALGSSFSFL